MLAVGTSPVGIIAIGANATGIIAIGALATGVVAIGQLARGGIVLGQLALGLVSIGQLGVGVVWASGQVGIGGTSGPGLILGLFGRLRLLGRRSFDGPRWDLPAFRRPRSIAVRLVVLAAVVVLWWLAAGQWLADDLTRPGGILVDPPRRLR